MRNLFGAFSLSRLRATSVTSPFSALRMQQRAYRVWHYTNPENMRSIQSSDELQNGDGHHGSGVYFTKMQPGYHSNSEIKTAVRNPKIPHSAIAKWLSIDTDDLTKQGVSFDEKRMGAVVARPKKPLKLSSLNARFGDTPDDD